MSLFGKSSNEILDQAIADLRANTAITRFTPGAKARALLKAMGRTVGALYDTFDFNQIISFVSGATGIYLDFIGELVNVPRLPASQARVDATQNNIRFYTLSSSFGAINGGNAITIPAGTLISTPDTSSRVVRYRTISQYILPASQTQTYVSVEAVVEGSASNVGALALSVHNFTGYADSANGSLLTTNDSAIDNGQPTENDELYRFRIINSAFKSASANKTAIRLAALAIPSVSDINILEYKRGIGTSNLVIKSVTGRVTPEMILAVQASVDSTKAHSSHILVEGPIEIGVQFFISLRYRSGISDANKSLIEIDVAKALREYIRSLDIGESLIINEAVQRVMEVDDRIHDMGEPGRPFDDIFIFKDGVSSSDRIRRTLVTNYQAEPDEKLIIEESVSNPITIRRL